MTTTYSPKINTLARRHFALSMAEAALCDYLDWHVLNGESMWCEETKKTIAKELGISFITVKRAFKSLLEKDLISKREAKNQYRCTKKWLILTYFQHSIGLNLTYLENTEKSIGLILTRFEKIELIEKGFFDMEENAMWIIMSRFAKTKGIKMSPIDNNKKAIGINKSPIDSKEYQNEPDLKTLDPTILLTTKEIINNISSKVSSKIGKRNQMILKHDETLKILGREKFQIFLAWLYIRRMTPKKGETTAGGAEYTRRSQLEPIIEEFQKHSTQEIIGVIEYSKEKKYTKLFFDSLKSTKKNEPTNRPTKASYRPAEAAESYFD